MKTVYLAGPISGLDYDGAIDWRTEAQQKLMPFGLGGISPMRNKEFLRGRGALEGSYDEDLLSTSRGIITRDRYDATHADAVLFNLEGADRVSIGSMIEIGWADAVRSPTVGIMEDGGLHTHPMVAEAISFWARDLDEAVHALASLLVPHRALPLSSALPLGKRLDVSRRVANRGDAI